MTWTRLSDTFDGSTIDLSDAAFRTHVQALVWCNRQLSDGRLPNRAVRLVSVSDAAVDELVAAGLWTRRDDGYAVDWTDQELAATVQQRRDRNAAKNRAYRERQELHAVGDHTKCDARFCPNLSRDRSRDQIEPGHATRSRPVPSLTGTGSVGRRRPQEPKRPPTMSEQSAECSPGKHRILPDGTCMLCTWRGKAVPTIGKTA